MVDSAEASTAAEANVGSPQKTAGTKRELVDNDKADLSTMSSHSSQSSDSSGNASTEAEPQDKIQRKDDGLVMPTITPFSDITLVQRALDPCKIMNVVWKEVWPSLLALLQTSEPLQFNSIDHGWTAP